MSRLSSALTTLPVLPLRIGASTRWLQLGAVVVGTLALTASSWIQVPMVPVPMTLQTLAVTLVGACLGWRLGAVTVLAWLAEAALGLPVIATFRLGLAAFAGPTGGYLAAFLITAALVGFAAEKGLLARSVVLSFGIMLLANALILVIGGAWLAVLLGDPMAAMAKGVVPFLIGGVVKAALAAGLVEAAGSLFRRPGRRR